MKLFHGRDTTHETMTDWGFDGPALGPLESVQFTYGTLVLHTTTQERVELGRVEDLLFYDGKFYGDAVVCLAHEQPATEQAEQRKSEPTGWTGGAGAPIVVLKETELPAYRACVDVFVDSVLERVSSQAGAAAARSLNRVARTSGRS